MSPEPSGSALVEAVEAAWPVEDWRDVHVLAAVSGGADSVALLQTLNSIKKQQRGTGRLIVAHFNHGFRGAASDADADWVAALCKEMGVPCEIGRPDAPLDRDSEESARDARYAFLSAAAERLGARFVATAHTADDNVETLLMRLLRGTGMSGLAGVPKRRPLNLAVTLVRPMLSVRREQVLVTLRERGQAFRTDATNADTRYTRNRVRLELLPLLRERFGVEVDASLLSVAEQAAEAQAVLESVAQPLSKSGITRSSSASGGEDRLTIDRNAFAGVAPLIVAEAVKLAWRAAGWPEQAMGRQHWRHVGRLVQTDDAPDARHLAGGVDARRAADMVVLTRGCSKPRG